MPLVPIAAFLAGALLSIFLPTLLLIALVVWYWWKFSTRVPDTREADVPPAPAAREAAPATANPGPSAPSGYGTPPSER